MYSGIHKNKRENELSILKMFYFQAKLSRGLQKIPGFSVASFCGRTVPMTKDTARFLYDRNMLDMCTAEHSGTQRNTAKLKLRDAKKNVGTCAKRLLCCNCCVKTDVAAITLPYRRRCLGEGRACPW